MKEPSVIKINFRVTTELYKQIRKESADNMQTMTEYIKGAIDQRYKKEKHLAPDYEQTIKKILRVIDSEELNGSEKILIITLFRLGEQSRNIKELSRLTGYTEQTVKKICRKLYNTGVFIKLNYEFFDYEKEEY